MTKKKVAPRKPKSLKYIIAVRHGEYSNLTKELDDCGISQICALASRLSILLAKRKSVEVFSSPSLRAQQSAEIIAREFQTSIKVCDSLRSDEYKDGNQMLEELLSVRNGGDVLIAVTHYVAPSGIINAVCERFRKGRFGCREQAKGDGCMIHLPTGRVTASIMSSC